ncbi:hypothetical protein ABIA16_003586 [Sinorhizobium fredii]
MWWTRRKKETEMLPWYRQPTYKGKMTEVEKRRLDAYRMQPSHPAATIDELPEEVQSYINRLEIELYDKKQDMLAGRTIGVSSVGAAWLCINYFGLPAPTIWTYAFGMALLAVPWLIYQFEWKKNADEFLPKKIEPDALRPTDEGIRTEWELNYIVAAGRPERD